MKANGGTSGQLLLPTCLAAYTRQGRVIFSRTSSTLAHSQPYHDDQLRAAQNNEEINE
jgi:hypothetical protein